MKKDVVTIAPFAKEEVMERNGKKLVIDNKISTGISHTGVME